MKPLSSLTRNRHVAAISSAAPCRPSGIPLVSRRPARAAVGETLTGAHVIAGARKREEVEKLPLQLGGAPAELADRGCWSRLR